MASSIISFKSSNASEFSYTFDDNTLSFEEQVGMVASACFCEPIRFGNKLQLRFEKPQSTSVLLFNHRNKVSQSEKRTYKFGTDKDYDGVELEYTSPDDDKRVTYSVPENVTLTNAMKISTSGIRNHAVAKTRAWREWNKLQYQSIDCEFDGLDESELLARNDRILVADSTSLETQDGEIVAVDGLTLTCSSDVDFEENTQLAFVANKINLTEAASKELLEVLKDYPEYSGYLPRRTILADERSIYDQQLTREQDKIKRQVSHVFAKILAKVAAV